MRPTTEGKTEVNRDQRAPGGDQPSLPFAAAEGSCAERRLMLGNALVLVECDGALARLCELVFTHTGDGLGNPWPTTLDKLGARPWGLCCGRSKTSETLKRAEALGLVRAERKKTNAGADAGFVLAIDWPGVRQRLGLPRDPTGGRELRTPGRADQTLGRELRTLPSAPYLNSKSFFSYSENQIQNPDRSGPEPDPERSLFSSERRERVPDERLLTAVPELAAAAECEVLALPAGALLHGVFRPLGDAALQNPHGLVEWFRRQLSALAPAVGPSEAELLLVLASAVYAQKLRTVVKSRIAAFISVISRGEWRKVIPYIPDARRQLDGLLAQQPDLLTRGAVSATDEGAELLPVNTRGE